MKKNEECNTDYFGSSSDENSHKHGCPPECKDMREWNSTIQKMIDAFELMKYVHTPNPDESKTIEQGLDLFCKYYRNLWD